MFDWWEALSLATQIFYCVAIPATLVLLVQTLLLFFGIGDDDLQSEADVPDELADDISADAMDALRVFTVRGLVAFFVVFGWVGAAMSAAEITLWAVIPTAICSGLLMMLLLAAIFRAAMKLRTDGTEDNRNAIGASGRVHLMIPPRRSGEGKVHIMLQGAYVERNAVTDEEEPIATGSEIVVVRLSGQTTLVVRRK